MKVTLKTKKISKLKYLIEGWSIPYFIKLCFGLISITMVTTNEGQFVYYLQHKKIVHMSISISNWLNIICITVYTRVYVARAYKTLLLFGPINYPGLEPVEVAY